MLVGVLAAVVDWPVVAADEAAPVTVVWPTAMIDTFWRSSVSVPFKLTMRSTLSPGPGKSATPWTWSTEVVTATCPAGMDRAKLLEAEVALANIEDTSTCPTAKGATACLPAMLESFVTADVGRNSWGIFLCWMYPWLMALVPLKVAGTGFTTTYASTNLAL